MAKPEEALSSPTLMRIRVLKCRETGDTGAGDLLNYNRETGRIELAKSTLPETSAEKF
jgi:hypothetical protein